MQSLPPTDLTISLPLWLNEVVPWEAVFPSAEERMDLAIMLSRENIRRQTGGPFGRMRVRTGLGPTRVGRGQLRLA